MHTFIWIINGTNGVGKDTFIGNLRCSFKPQSRSKNSERERQSSISSISTIDTVKDMLRTYEIWDGEKDEASRLLMQRIKEAICEYSNYITESIVSRSREWFALQSKRFGTSDDISMMFIHCREPEEIKKLVDALNACFGDQAFIGTILIDRKDAPEVAHNKSDENVRNYNYDFTFDITNRLDDCVDQFANVIMSIVDGVETKRDSTPETISIPET